MTVLTSGADTVTANPPPPPPALDIRGLVDNASATVLHGWVFNRLVPGQRLRVELMFDETSLGRTVADAFRPDLQPNGIGDGHHAFEFAVSPEHMSRLDQMEVIATSDDGQTFPLPIRLHSAPPQAAPQAGSGAGSGVAEPVVIAAQAAQAAQGAQPAVVQQPQPAPAPQRPVTETVPLANQAVVPVEAETASGDERQDDLKQRLEVLEVWLARLDRQLADVQTPPVVAKPGPDPWQMALFGLLLVSLVAAVSVAVIWLR